MNNTMNPPTIDIVIPTLNAARHLPACLGALRNQRVTIVDGGSSDDTIAVATSLGADVTTSPPGRGRQLALGASQTTAEWLLFLHADTVLDAGWTVSAATFMAMHPDSVATFTFALDDPSPAARRLERIVAWRSQRLRLPYGDQGLMMARKTYNLLGGFRPLPIMEDVDLIRRVPDDCLHILPVRAVTSAERYHHDGYWRRPLWNLTCQVLWRLGVPADTVARLYR